MSSGGHRQSQIEGQCLICKKDGPVVLDHCHRTNKVRGRICGRCNLALGLFNDDIETIISAVIYLQSFEALPDDKKTDYPLHKKVPENYKLLRQAERASKKALLKASRRLRVTPEALKKALQVVDNKADIGSKT